ncbi:MAG: glycosyltransferase, partial [Bacteroidales bacterium]|nr:glycosyltransferase [Bacteroidales bacterium]
MKIIFDGRVLTHTHFTGVENYTKSIYNYLTKKTNVFLLKPKSKNKYLTHLWNHFILPFKHGDLLFCPANIAPFFVPKNKKLVLTLHDVAFLTYPDSFSSFFRSYYQWLVPKVIHRADKIITISQSSKKEIIKYYPHAKNKIEVISLGLDNNFHLLPNIEKKNQILYVGSLNTRKNFISVIKAFNQLAQGQYQLVIVGNFSSNFHLDKTTQGLLEKAKRNPNI